MKYPIIIFISLLLTITSCQTEPPTQKYLEMEQNINSHLPYDFNNQMRLDKVKALSKYKFKYFYTLLNKPTMPINKFVSETKPLITNKLKGSAGAKDFKEDKITIIYSYSDTDGNIFAEFEISPNDY